MCYLLQNSHEGITGLISFGENGYRDAFELVIFQIKENFLEKGFWNTSIGLNMTIDYEEILDLNDNMFNTNLLVEITLVSFILFETSTFPNVENCHILSSSLPRI